MHAALTMTKIVVADVDAAAAFYMAVCGFTIAQRIEDDRFCEIILQSAEAASAALIVINYKGAPPATPGECILVFETSDIGAFVARVVAAGGSVTTPTQTIAALDLAYAMLCDPEGHIVEALQRGGVTK